MVAASYPNASQESTWPEESDMLVDLDRNPIRRLERKTKSARDRPGSFGPSLARDNAISCDQLGDLEATENTSEYELGWLRPQTKCAVLEAKPGVTTLISQ